MKETDVILQRLGIEGLNDMQKDAMNAIMRTKSDVVVLSPTGSGKTLAYLLPLTKQLNADSNQLQAVVIVPGRELALQSSEVLKSMGCGLRSMALYGGRPTMDEHRELRRQLPQVVFATPGRLNDHLDKGNILPDDVKWLVIDEFDKCLEMGFLGEMERLMTTLKAVERRILLSATESDSIPRFVRLGRVTRLDYRVEEEQVSSRVYIYKVLSPEPDKLPVLQRLLLDFGPQKSVVFLNHRESVERVASFLRDRGFWVSMFHGGLEQKLREDALYQFANGSNNVLVCTDLASRGLDIPDIDNIIHYHLPETEQNYIHRVGRTARWDKQGRAFFLLKAGETIPAYLKEQPEDYSWLTPSADLRRLPPLPLMATLYIGKGKRDKISKGDIVGFLCKKGGLSAAEIGRISVEERFSYVAVSREKLQQVLRKTRGEKIKGVKTLFEIVKS